MPNRWVKASERIEETKRVGASALDLAGMNLDSIPPEAAGLQHVEVVKLNHNNLSTIPEQITGLTDLEVLYLQNNQIDTLTRSLTRLPKLRYLFLGHNRIRAIPEFVIGLQQLEHLSLDNNQIETIPEFISKLTNLRSLSLAKNKIRTVPASIADLPNLQSIDLAENPLADELKAPLRRGLQPFLRYLRSVATRKAYARTVKLVLLGEPQSGKTTLLEALKGNPHPCDENREETIGVNVVTIQKDHPVDGQPMYLSAWDFAGQHMEHATHQFFLTENAIYLILWNARQGTESGRRDLWYWLELLKMRVPNPSILLVATHTALTPPDLDLSEVARSYAGCQGQFPVELSNLEGFGALEKRILELAGNSPSLGAEWPPEWLNVRDEIRRIRKIKAYIKPPAFQALLARHSVTTRQAQQDLAIQLHHLGEVLYFPERRELAGLVVLNPEWVTELIGVVVRSEVVRKQGGMLRQHDLNILWKHARLSSDIRDHLIHLMDFFDLTYATSDPDEIGIVVEATPYSTPSELREMEPDPTRPQMEMIFRFPSLQRRLPPGIPTWGIARAHRLSRRRPWRDAAAFEDSETNSQALIIASSGAREVRLRVSGEYPPFFFGRLEAILRDTFRRYPGLIPQRRMPCTCHPKCPSSYLFETVVNRAREGKEFVSCDDSGADVPIQSLLTGFPQPSTSEGRRAFESDVRRLFTEQLRSQREQMEKTCPSVFTLVPSHDFRQLDTWIESATKDDELELTLFCEHDSGWHPTAHSLYRFRPDKEWFDLVKKGWNRFACVTRHVGPLAKAIGRAAGLTWVEVTGLGIEKFPEAETSPGGGLTQRLAARDELEPVDIETRFLLEQLIEHLDASRSELEPRRGGLHPYLVDDGRLLWLCPAHVKSYQSRP